MNSPRPHLRRQATGNWRRATANAFTFAEVMFAVMILGIGFIMVAAMFPVAIRQTQSTVEDINGLAESQRGQAIIRQLGPSIAGAVNTANPQPYAHIVIDRPAAGTSPNRLYSFFTNFAANTPIPFDAVKGNVINKLDPRFAWIPVAYQAPLQQMNGANRVAFDANGNLTTAATGTVQIPETAKVWVVALQKRDPDNPTYSETAAGNDRDTGTPEIYVAPPGTPNPTRDGCFKPKQVYFKLVEGEAPDGTASYPDTLVFTNSSGTPTEELAAAEGAYVWVADDQVTVAINASATIYAYNPGDANGRFYRLGAKLDAALYGPGVYELIPGADMTISLDAGPDGLSNTSDDGPPKTRKPPPPQVRLSPPYASSTPSTAYAAIPGNPAIGLMIGRGLKNPAAVFSATNPYVGGAQDLIALPPVTISLRTR